ncbi:hypothetical protein LIER_38439 [Lithospermum erythrorhizon]|uniref:Uncharacterized protein n=1 Tax=Lithospermum erythrorhizon TaxID=34254 RepID=A0AAV3Q080_LITER
MSANKPRALCIPNVENGQPSSFQRFPHSFCEHRIQSSRMERARGPGSLNDGLPDSIRLLMGSLFLRMMMLHKT